MNPSIKKILLLSCFLLLSVIMRGQKSGYLNLEQIVSQMPEMRTANNSLVEYQAKLIAAGETMATDFQKKYIDFIKLAEQGSLTPEQQQEQQAKLEIQQQKVAGYEQEINLLLEAKKDDLLRPILDKIKRVVKEVAKENGFELIFDSSIHNAVLMADESLDIMPLVKAKLGI